MRNVVCMMLAGFISLTAYADESMHRIGQQGRWLVDEQGRVVMLRGGNLQLPGAHEGEGGADDQTPRLLAEKGFNAVRLVIFFSELMPRPGSIDGSYLDRIASTVADYRRAGVYVLIDFHQDEYGAAVGVRGFPAWATFTGGHSPKKLPFPAGYFGDPAIQTAFDSFWRNHPVPKTNRGVQDFYIDALVAVAKRFRDEPAVFGIDIMNEPFPGTRCNQPDPARANCPELEQQLLAPFYERAGKAIASVAPRTIVFVEPFMLQGALGIPIATPPAGEPALRGLSYHQYGTLAEIRKRGNANALASALKTGSAILNTEWGFTNDPIEWTAQAQELDDLLVPWLAWARGSFAPLIDSSKPASGNDNREATLRALARPYPRATAGTPLQLGFDGASGTLRFTFSTAAPDGRQQPGGMTEIVMPATNFPQGYTLSIDERQVQVVSKADAGILQLRTKEPGAEVVITAKRKGDLAPLPPVVATADPYAFLATGPAQSRQKGDALSTNSLLGDLLGDAHAKAVLEKELPELIASPQVGMGSQMSLRALQAFAPAMLTNEVLDRIDRALANQPKKPMD